MRSRNHIPYIIPLKLVQFFLHDYNPSSNKSSSTEVGSIMEISHSIDYSSLNANLVPRGLSLFPTVTSYGWEDLYLRVFFDCLASWETQEAFLELASSGSVSEVGISYEPSDHLASEALVSGHNFLRDYSFWSTNFWWNSWYKKLYKSSKQPLTFYC